MLNLLLCDLFYVCVYAVCVSVKLNMSEKTEIKKKKQPKSDYRSCSSQVCQSDLIQIGFIGLVFNKAFQSSLKTVIMAIMIRKENA